MTEARDLSIFVKRDAQGIAHMELAVEGVGCAGCIRKIENGLKQLPGITDARLNFTNRRLAVDWRDKALNAAEVIDALDLIRGTILVAASDQECLACPVAIELMQGI